MLYPINLRKEEMITIEYSPDGVAVADHKAEEFVRDLVSHAEKFVSVEKTVSTENVITIARVLKKEEDIDVRFKFEDKILIPDKDGRLEHWPDGFSDFWNKNLMRLF